MLLVTVAIPEPSVFDDAPLWITFVVAPAYIAVALAVGDVLDHPADRARAALGNRGAQAHAATTNATPSWPRGGSRPCVLILWGIGTALLTTLYGMANTHVHPAISVLRSSFSGILVATA